ncbi:hypothetical protein SCHPADRAFT_897604, partial [Schizopora paradoxa]
MSGLHEERLVSCHCDVHCGEKITVAERRKCDLASDVGLGSRDAFLDALHALDNKEVISSAAQDGGQAVQEGDLLTMESLGSALPELDSVAKTDDQGDRAMHIHGDLFVLDHRLQKLADDVDEQVRSLEHAMKHGLPDQAVVEQMNLSFSRIQIQSILADVSDLETDTDPTNKKYKEMIVDRASECISIIGNHVAGEKKSASTHCTPVGTKFVDC